MPRNYNTNTSGGGTNMVGRAYTPQVAPWDRADDDVSVQRSLRNDPGEWRDGRDDRSLDRDYDYRDRRDVRERNNETYYGRDLVPGYGEDYAGYQSGYRDWRDDDRRYRAERRAREQDGQPRYQYNDYRPVSDDDYGGYRREGDRSGWVARDHDHDRERAYREDRYNGRERYYANDRYRADRHRNDEAMRGRWNRR